MPIALVVHGGAGVHAAGDLAEREAAVSRGLDAGWLRIRAGALAAAVAAVEWLEDEPSLNAGVGACLNMAGEPELDAGVMDGATLRAAGVGAVRDVRHPVDLALRVMEDGRHVLLVAEGASLFARASGLETCDPSTFVTERRRAGLTEALSDTVGAVALDAAGHIAVAVSTGGTAGKLPGRVGDSPVPGAGYYADDARGAACGTGRGEDFLRLSICRQAVMLLEGASAQEAAEETIRRLTAAGGRGGVILVDRRGGVGAAFNTQAMPWAHRVA